MTDRQTDNLPRHSPCYTYASRGKNGTVSSGWIYNLRKVQSRTSKYRQQDRYKRWSQKPRVSGLPDGEMRTTLRSLVLTQYQRVTNRQTDTLPTPMSRSNTAECNKNERIKRTSRRSWDQVVRRSTDVDGPLAQSRSWGSSVSSE